MCLAPDLNIPAGCFIENAPMQTTYERTFYANLGDTINDNQSGVTIPESGRSTCRLLAIQNNPTEVYALVPNDAGDGIVVETTYDLVGEGVG